MKELNQKTAN